MLIKLIINNYLSYVRYFKVLTTGHIRQFLTVSSHCLLIVTSCTGLLIVTIVMERGRGFKVQYWPHILSKIMLDIE